MWKIEKYDGYLVSIFSDITQEGLIILVLFIRPREEQ